MATISLLETQSETKANNLLVSSHWLFRSFCRQPWKGMLPPPAGHVPHTIPGKPLSVFPISVAWVQAHWQLPGSADKEILGPALFLQAWLKESSRTNESSKTQEEERMTLKENKWTIRKGYRKRPGCCPWVRGAWRMARIGGGGRGRYTRLATGSQEAGGWEGRSDCTRSWLGGGCR